MEASGRGRDFGQLDVAAEKMRERANGEKPANGVGRFRPPGIALWCLGRRRGGGKRTGTAERVAASAVSWYGPIDVVGWGRVEWALERTGMGLSRALWAARMCEKPGEIWMGFGVIWLPLKVWSYL